MAVSCKWFYGNCCRSDGARANVPPGLDDNKQGDTLTIYIESEQIFALANQSLLQSL